MSGWDEMAMVGRVTRPHGLRGDVVVNPETDFVEERFKVGATLWTRSDRGDEALTVGTMRLQNGRAVIGFVGCARIEDAERLAGLELRVPEETLQPLGDHQFYLHQLVGCAVETVAGEPVGNVTRVDGGISVSMLVITGPRGEVLVPFTQAFCVNVDIGARRIRIDPPAGLLELNEIRRRDDFPADGGSRPRGRRRQPGH